MKIYVYLLLCSIFFICNGKIKVHKNHMTVAHPKFDVAAQLFGASAIGSETRVLINHLPHLFYHNHSHHNVSNACINCINSINTFEADLLGGERYTQFALDSWGKVESGILFANFKWLGSYKECMAAQSSVFKPKYCFFTFGHMEYKNAFIFDGNFPLNIGACVPDTCPVETLTEMFHHYNANITVSCPKQYSEWRTLDFFALIFCLLLVILAITATSIENALKRSGQRYFLFDNTKISPALSATAEDVSWMTSANNLDWLWKLASAFSVTSSFKKIFDTEQQQGDITCLHGLRFISITWVILGHSYLLLMNFSDNLVSMLAYTINNWEFQAVINGTYSVDTFFFLGGLLACYTIFHNLIKTDGKINILKLYLHRYLRLTPLYGFVILMFVSLYLKTIEGPLWPEVIRNSVETCNRIWYTNLLYINNLYPANLADECYIIGWYLANDFQFYLFAPLLVILLYRNRLMGMIVISAILLASIAITGVFSSYTQQLALAEMFGINANYGYTNAYGLPVNVTLQLPDLNQNFYMSDLYAKPWCRISSYLIGMLTGYFLCIKKSQFKMNKYLVAIGWLVSAAICCSIVYSLYPTAAYGYKLSNNVAAFYNGVSRPLWSVCMAWIIIACTNGYGGPVNSFLSWKYFFPLSRLTYAVYLVHPMVVWWYLGSNDRLFHFNLQNFILLFTGTLVLSIGLALACVLFIEYPFIALTKATIRARNTAPVVVENSTHDTGAAEED